MILGSEADGHRAFAHVDHAGDAHRRFHQLHAAFLARLLQLPVAGQVFQHGEVAAITGAHQGNQQAGADAFGRIVEQRFGALLEAAHLADRAGFALEAAQDRLDVQRRAEHRADQADAAVILLLGTCAQVIQVARQHVAVAVVGDVGEPFANGCRCFIRRNQAAGLVDRRRGAGEDVAGIDHAHHERAGHAGLLTHLAIILEDAEAGLVDVLVDRAAGGGDGQAEHAVLLQHQLLQEQLLDLFHRARLGFGRVTAVAQPTVNEPLDLLGPAIVHEDFAIDLDRDRHHRDVVLLKELLRKIAGRIDCQTHPHQVIPLLVEAAET